MSKFKMRLSGSIKSLLLNKTFDLFIVIVGVSIAFQLNNFKLNSDQKTLERFYLENLITDIDKDVVKMNEILISLRSDKRWTEMCLSKRANGTLSADTLAKTIVEMLSLETFNSRNENTYTALMNSHGLSIISNPDARNLITDYYKSYRSIDRFEDVFTQFLLNDFNSYFSEYVDYANVMIVDPSVLKKAQTNNSLLLAAGQLNDGVETYKEALEAAADLKSKLKAEL